MVRGNLLWLGMACATLVGASCSSDSGDSGAPGAAAVSGSAGDSGRGDSDAGRDSVAGSGNLAGAGGDKTPHGGTSGGAAEAAATAGSGEVRSDAGNGGGGGGSGGAVTSGESGATGAGGSADGGAGGQPGLTPLGDISGACGVIDAAMLASASPSNLGNSITLGPTGFMVDALSTEGSKVYDSALAGGGGQPASEALSFEILRACDAADLVKTEDEIVYDTDGAKTDYSIRIDGVIVGVAVVRALGFPDDTNFTVQSASDLLEKKLLDIIKSTGFVSEADGWQKQILHVVARSAQTAATTLTAYASFTPDIQADTILLVTTTNGSDEAFYGN